LEKIEKLKKAMPMKAGMSAEAQLEYKYQLWLDGFHATFPGDRWRLYSGSLTFRQTTDYEMFFYDLLKPWVHYIPVDHYLDNLKEQILWAKSYDSECCLIAQNARQFVKEHAMPEHIALYCYKVILKYASLQKFQP
jgi:hypothetical protein